MLKKISVNSSGQATVEYILMIAVLASIVGGLISFNGAVEAKFKGAKVDLRDKLAGAAGTGATLHREDFFTKKGNIGSAGSGNGKSGGENGDGDKDGGGTKGGGGGSKGGKQAPSQTAPTGSGAKGLKGSSGGGSGSSPSVEYDKQRRENEQAEMDRENAAAIEYKNEQLSPEEKEKQKEKEMISERQLALVSAEEKARLLKKAREDGIISDNTAAAQQRDWNIGKVILIIMVILFIVVMLLKSKRD